MYDEHSQLDFEEGVVGATFSRWEEARAYQGKLVAEDFTNENCAAAWAIFCAATTMDDYLSGLSKRKLAVFVSNCSDSMLANSPGMLPWAIDNVRKNGMKRRVRQGLRDVFDRDGDLLTEITSLIDRERQRQDTTETQQLPSKLYREVMDDIANNDLDSRLYTGIGSIDTILGGLRIGNVSILGAEPSTGKTTLALNIAMNALRKGRKVVFFSLEMSAVQLVERMVASTGKISYERISNKQLSLEAQQLFAGIAMKLMQDGNLYVFDTIYYLEQMVQQIIELKPDLVIVDFLQFSRTAVPTNSTADRLEYIVSEFKRIAKLPYCQCHVMLLSQPSRQSGQEKQSMFTLKGSSAIEQGGDVIMLLDRPAVRDLKEPPERASVKVSKNKFGRTGLVSLYFDGDHQRFREPKVNDSYTRIATQEEVAERPW